MSTRSTLIDNSRGKRNLAAGKRLSPLHNRSHSSKRGAAATTTGQETTTTLLRDPPLRRAGSGQYPHTTNHNTTSNTAAATLGINHRPSTAGNKEEEGAGHDFRSTSPAMRKHAAVIRGGAGTSAVAAATPVLGAASRGGRGTGGMTGSATSSTAHGRASGATVGPQRPTLRRPAGASSGSPAGAGSNAAVSMLAPGAHRRRSLESKEGTDGGSSRMDFATGKSPRATSMQPSCGATPSNANVVKAAIKEKSTGHSAQQQPEQQQQQQQQQQYSVRAGLELRPALGDGDVNFYKDSRNWQHNLLEAVVSLLDGSTIEQPFTSHLWKQAYDTPANVSDDGEGDISSSSGNNNNNNGGARPKPRLHRYSSKITDGYYACVRCGVPVCAPRNQVVNTAQRGLATFQRVNAEAMEVHFSPEALLTVAADGTSPGRGSSGSRQRLSFMANAAAFETHSLSFLVRCRHCNGCLGTVTLDVPNSMLQHVESGEVFSANSACLVYVPCTTACNLDGVVAATADADGEGSSGNAERHDGVDDVDRLFDLGLDEYDLDGAVFDDE